VDHALAESGEAVTAMHARNMERTTSAPSASFIGEFAFPRAALAFETESLRAVAPHFTKLNAAPAEFSIDPGGQFRGFRRARAQVGRTTFDYFQIDCSAGNQIVSTRPHEDEYFLFVPFRGTIEVVQGSARIAVAPGQIALVGSASHTQKRYRENAELLVIQITRQMLTKTLADEYGPLADPMIEFEPRVVADFASVPTLGRFIAMLCRDAGEARPCIADPTTARACERTLILLLVQSFPHNLSGRLPQQQSQGAPYYVRRVQDFIRTNAARPVTAAQMTALAGVSPRALYYGFKRTLGVPPMKYLKHVRLDAARAALHQAGPLRRTVTEIALASGYTSVSRFCRDYRAQFGETPSATMRQR
jgi:AraC-like DNA-binding protein